MEGGMGWKRHHRRNDAGAYDAQARGGQWRLSAVGDASRGCEKADVGRDPGGQGPLSQSRGEDGRAPLVQQPMEEEKRRTKKRRRKMKRRRRWQWEERGWQQAEAEKEEGKTEVKEEALEVAAETKGRRGEEEEAEGEDKTFDGSGG